MAKFKRYDSYKNSGVEWLGEIPSHWEMVKFKHLFYEKRKTYDINLNCGSISFGNIVEKDDEKIPLSTKASYQVLNKGEFLINPLNLNYDLKSLRIGLSNLDVVVSSGYIVIKNKVDINKKYFNYLLHIYDILFMKILGAGVRQTLNFNDIGKTLLVIPPKDEQEKIALYLDEKMAKIDASISGKEKFIELLKEQKQIIINDAVTKGLNKNAKFKNSGVEWLGEIPSHWEILANKYIFKLKRNLVGKRSNKYVLLSLTLDGIVERDLDKGGKFPAEFYTYQEVKNGDFVFCLFDIEETPRTIGLSEYDGMITGAYTVFDVRNVSKKYLYYFYLNLDNNKRLKPLYLGLRNTISKENFFSFKTFIPPKDEQEKIAEYIENKISKIDKLINLEQEYIKSLKEYKASLIDSVVTGKVRV